MLPPFYNTLLTGLMHQLYSPRVNVQDIRATEQHVHCWVGNRQVIILLRAESWDTVKVRYLKHLEYVVMNFGHFQQGC